MAVYKQEGADEVEKKRQDREVAVSGYAGVLRRSVPAEWDRVNGTATVLQSKMQCADRQVQAAAKWSVKRNL